MNFNRAEVRDHKKVLILPKRTKAIFGDVSDENKIALPAAYNEEGTFEVNLNGNGQLWVHVHVLNLGAGGLTGVTLLVSFQSPEFSQLWLPSKEGVSRTDTPANHEWACNAVGNFILATRAEHKHFKKARVQFKRTAGAPDAATSIMATWYHDGLMSPEQ